MFKKIFLLLTALAVILTSFLQAEEVADEYPVAILGGGVGALTSATYLARGGIAPIVITGPIIGGAINQSNNVENWPGEVAISGEALGERLRRQAEKNGAVLKPEIVVSVDFSKRPFTITTRKLFQNKEAQFKTYRVSACIIGLGANPNMLGVPGEMRYWSRGVYTCAVCDGSLYQDKIVAVVGGGDSSLTETQYLSNIAKKVYLIVRRDQLKTIEGERAKEILARPNVEVRFETEIQEIKGDDKRATALVVKNKQSKDLQEIPVDALFLAIGAQPNTQLFQGQLELDPSGYIILKNHQQTSVEGVYAVGDVADPEFKQAISAAGDAAKAALQAQKHLLSYHPPQKKEATASKKDNTTTVLEVTSLAQLKLELKSASGPIFVDFYSTRCPPCRMFSPVYDEWAKEFAGRIKFLKVNADQASEVFAHYGIQAVPTLIIFDAEGQVIRKSIGGRGIADIEGSLEVIRHQDTLAPSDFR